MKRDSKHRLFPGIDYRYFRRDEPTICRYLDWWDYPGKRKLCYEPIEDEL